MINAKEELLSKLQDLGNKNTQKKIKCAIIRYIFKENEYLRIILKLNYSEKEYNDFLNSLDFIYNNRYGNQKVYGTVWFQDNSWLTRSEYDGHEWWDHVIVPEIPEECIPVNSVKYIVDFKTTEFEKYNIITYQTEYEYFETYPERRYLAYLQEIPEASLHAYGPTWDLAISNLKKQFEFFQKQQKHI